MKDVLAAFLV